MNEREMSRNTARRLATLRHAEGRPLPKILEEVARLGAQLLMQAALEAEVTEFPAAAATSGPRPVRTRVPVPVAGTGR